MNNHEPGIGYGLTRDSLLASVPTALRQDPSIVALTKAVASALGRRTEEIDRLRIYARIDELEEPLLSALAYDFKVDWWDPDYNIEEKRQTLKDSWIVHIRIGTSYAVDTGIRAIFPVSYVE